MCPSAGETQVPGTGHSRAERGLSAAMPLHMGAPEGSGGSGAGAPGPSSPAGHHGGGLASSRWLARVVLAPQGKPP